MSTVRVAKPAAFPDLGQEHWVLEASAGTGKTYTLEHLVVDLVLEAGIPLEKILVVTFTEAAALELRRRIRGKLQELRDLRTNRDLGGAVWVLDDAARARLDAALQTFDRAMISTIHAFCRKVLQDSAFDAGRHFRQERVHEDDLFSEVFRTQLRTTLSASPEDRAFLLEALDFTGSAEALEALLKEAWKARAVMVPDVGILARAEVAMAAFPAGATTDVAALKAVFGKSTGKVIEKLNELSELMVSRSANPPLGFWVALGDLPVLQPVNDKDKWRQSLWLELATSGPVPGLRAALTTIIENLPTPEAVLVHRLLRPLEAALRARKDAEGLFDFNDMIDQVAEGLDRPGLVERLRERYAAALIDEFQDTDARQWEIFRRVFHTEGHRLYLVGDPKQAIYDFRGGDLPTYLQARDAVLGAGGGRLDLRENFRSSPALISAVDSILAPGGGDFFTGDNTYGEGVTPGRRGVRLHHGGVDLSPLRLLRVPVDDKVGRLRNDLAARIAHAFRQLVDGGAMFDPGTGAEERRLHPGDCMVLTRTRTEGLLMAEALRAAGLPVAFFKADGLFQTREALELRDLLRGLLAPDDADARGRALLTRFFGMDLTEAEACLDLPPDHPVRLRLERWQDLARQRRYPRLFNAILEESGIVRRLLILEAGDRALTNLHHLVELLRVEARSAHLGPEDLLARLEAWIRERELPAVDDAETQRAEGEARAVRILTIHKAKGLEAPVVALFGGYSRPIDRGEIHRFHDAAGVRSVFLGSPPPAIQTILEQEAAEEQQRLLYVAITRPKAQLILPVFEPGGLAAGTSSSFDAEGHPTGLYGLLNPRPRLPPRESFWTEWATELASDKDEAATAAPPAPALGPPPVLPTLPEPEAARLARIGRPLQLLSFTSLSKAFGEGVRIASREEGARAYEVDTPRPARTEGGLPGGTATGSALHELLEALPPGDTRGSGLAAWTARHRLLAEGCLRENGLDPGFAPEALRLAWHALATPVPLPGGPTIPLDAVGRRLPEMAFQMPFPGHPDGLEGSMDMIFEVEDRLYVLDWKTNTLPDGDYGPAAVAAAVAEHYTLQVHIYILAALAFAGIGDEDAYEARFGGVLYLFLRGMPAGGVWTDRPAWSDVQAWRRELAALPLEAHALARMERGMHG